MSKPLSETIRDALLEAVKAEEPATAILAHVDAAGIDHSYLRYITSSPSGKTYGVLTVGQAEAWLKSLGIRVAIDPDGRNLRTFEFEVTAYGSTNITVEAYDEDDAYQQAEKMAHDEDWFVFRDVDLVGSSDGVKRGAA